MSEAVRSPFQHEIELPQKRRMGGVHRGTHAYENTQAQSIQDILYKYVLCTS